MMDLALSLTEIAHLRDLETRLLQQDVRLNESALTALLAEDFVEFGASGRVWTRSEVISGLLNESFVTRSIHDFELRSLATDTVLATYRCACSSADGIESMSLRSSVWRKHSDGWQMEFHQGTNIPA